MQFSGNKHFGGSGVGALGQQEAISLSLSLSLSLPSMYVYEEV